MIRLQFVLGSGLSSQVIAWFSSGHFSHVDAILPDGSLLGARSDVITPLGGGPVVKAGVQIRPPFYEHWKERVVMSLPATDAQTDAFLEFNHQQLGKAYDKTAIWGFISGRDWRDPQDWFCSELQAAALEVSGRCPNLYAPRNKITPAALALTVSALGASTA